MIIQLAYFINRPQDNYIVAADSNLCDGLNEDYGGVMSDSVIYLSIIQHVACLSYQVLNFAVSAAAKHDVSGASLNNGYTQIEYVCLNMQESQQ